MSEIKVNVTASKQQKVTVSSIQNSTEITTSADTGRFWAQNAKNWAVSDVIVDNTDYSSKHYAQEAKTSAQNAESYENSVKSTYNSFIEMSDDAIVQIQGTKEETLTDIEASRLNAVDSINTVKDESIATVENKANEALTLVNNGITQINTTKNTAVNDINATKTNILKDIEFVAEGEKEEIQELADKAKDDIESTGFYMRDDKLYFINSEGQEEEFKSGDINNKITNCLLEVPQNIKLELNNGVLTLKAGSQVIVPNGFEADGTTPKFDYVTVESDISASSVSTTSAQRFWQVLGGAFDNAVTSYVYSGNTATMNATTAYTYARFYNTETNYIYAGNGSSWVVSGLSLPIALITNGAGTIDNIDQVFNGMGYIGSTIWVDKGVKGLIPNGRNEDGSLKNIEYTNPTLKTLTQSGTYNLNVALARTALGAYYYEFDSENNYIYRPDTGARYYDRFIIGDLSTVNSKITSFQPKQPFRAVDYNDKAEIVSWGMPDYSRATTWNTSGGVVPYDAVIVFYSTNPSNLASGVGGMKITIDGVCVYAVRSNEYEATVGSFIGYVPKGANVTATTKSGAPSYAYIIPLKGAK